LKGINQSIRLNNYLAQKPKSKAHPNQPTSGLDLFIFLID
jgi:hypothetical protein